MNRFGCEEFTTLGFLLARIRGRSAQPGAYVRVGPIVCKNRQLVAWAQHSNLNEQIFESRLRADAGP
jgi:hypothetical protein